MTQVRSILAGRQLRADDQIHLRRKPRLKVVELHMRPLELIRLGTVL